MYEDTLLEKLQYILSNKELIKQAIKDIGSETISDETLFKDYSSEIMKIHSSIVEVCKMLYFLVYGGDINEVRVEEPTIKDTIPYIQQLSKAKSQLVDNLVLKGINSSITEEFLDLVDKVLLITSSTPSGGVDAEYVATMLDNINGEIIPKDDPEPEPEPEPSEQVLFEKELYNNTLKAEYIIKTYSHDYSTKLVRLTNMTSEILETKPILFAQFNEESKTTANHGIFIFTDVGKIDLEANETKDIIIPYSRILDYYDFSECDFYKESFSSNNETLIVSTYFNMQYRVVCENFSSGEPGKYYILPIVDIKRQNGDSACAAWHFSLDYNENEAYGGSLDCYNVLDSYSRIASLENFKYEYKGYGTNVNSVLSDSFKETKNIFNIDNAGYPGIVTYRSLDDNNVYYNYIAFDGNVTTDNDNLKNKSVGFLLNDYMSLKLDFDENGISTNHSYLNISNNIISMPGEISLDTFAVYEFTGNKVEDNLGFSYEPIYEIFYDENYETEQFRNLYVVYNNSLASFCNRYNYKNLYYMNFTINDEEYNNNGADLQNTFLDLNYVVVNFNESYNLTNVNTEVSEVIEYKPSEEYTQGEMSYYNDNHLYIDECISDNIKSWSKVSTYRLAKPIYTLTLNNDTSINSKYIGNSFIIGGDEILETQTDVYKIYETSSNLTLDKDKMSNISTVDISLSEDAMSPQIDLVNMMTPIDVSIDIHGISVKISEDKSKITLSTSRDTPIYVHTALIVIKDTIDDSNTFNSFIIMKEITREEPYEIDASSLTIRDDSTYIATILTI